MTSFQPAIRPKVVDESGGLMQAIQRLPRIMAETMANNPIKAIVAIAAVSFALLAVATGLYNRRHYKKWIPDETNVSLKSRITHFVIVLLCTFGANCLLATAAKVQLNSLVNICAIAGLSLLTASLKDRLSNYKSTVVKPGETELEKTKNLLNEAKKNLAEKEEERKKNLADKEIELTELRAQLEAEINLKKRIEKQKKDLEETIKDVETERDGKQKRLEAAETKARASEEVHESNANIIIQLRTDVFKGEKALERAVEKTKAVEGERDALQGQLDEALAKAKENKILLKNAVEAKKLQDARIKNLETDLEEAQEKIDKLIQVNAELKKKIPGFFDSINIFKSSPSKASAPVEQPPVRVIPEEPAPSKYPTDTPTQGSDSKGTGSQVVGTTSEQDHSTPLSKSQQHSPDSDAAKLDSRVRGIRSFGFPGKKTPLSGASSGGSVVASTIEEIEGGSSGSSGRKRLMGQKKQDNITSGKNDSISTEGEAGSNQSPLPDTQPPVRTETAQGTRSEKKPSSSSGRPQRRNSAEGYLNILGRYDPSNPSFGGNVPTNDEEY